jgi:hypothetical protein
MNTDSDQSRFDRAGIRESERDTDLRVLRKAGLASVGLVLSFYLINALSVSSELNWAGSTLPPNYPWVLEGSAILAMIAGLPIALYLGHRFPVEPGRFAVSIPVHIAGMLVYGLVQITLMFTLRDLLWPALFNATHQIGSDVVDNVIYELRKQGLAYIAFQIILGTTRSLERAYLEARVARGEAKTTHRITLKCGGRTMHLAANDFISAKSAGNYVDARFGDHHHLARMTLSQLEILLSDASVHAIRVHRSWLINRDQITQVDPTGEGDVTITLTNSETVPGSRRYRDRLDAR